MSPIYTPGKVVLAKVSQSLDVDAQAYVNAVEVADGQRIEDPVRFAINNFVIGCKADGIWTAIKASCILAGARTLTGALVPLVKQPADSAPARFGTEGGWNYNRKTGLQANGTDNYINSGRNNNADPQNNNHNAAYINTVPTSGATIMGAGVVTTGATSLLTGATRNRNTTAQNYSSITTGGFVGASRALSTAYANRANGTTLSVTQASETPANGNMLIFARNGLGTDIPLGPTLYANPRLAFYSIGESLDLQKLDARVTDLINAFGVAIP